MHPLAVIQLFQAILSLPSCSNSLSLALSPVSLFLLRLKSPWAGTTFHRFSPLDFHFALFLHLAPILWSQCRLYPGVFFCPPILS